MQYPVLFDVITSPLLRLTNLKTGSGVVSMNVVLASKFLVEARMIGLHHTTQSLTCQDIDLHLGFCSMP